jgi:putative transposase
MPWQETCTVELREQLVLAALAGEAGVAALCRRAGVSRKTAYKWLERYRENGRAGLMDRSRARHTQEHRVSDFARRLTLEMRTEHSTWGVKKILPRLERRYPWLDLPCQSTAGEILKHAKLSRPQKRRHRQQGAIGEGAAPGTPNHTWTTDFKGEFRLGNGGLCYPLTIADAFSRYLLCVDCKPGTHTQGAMRSFRRVFDEHGLPERIRSDNGVPFAGNGLARLSQLSVWFMQLGIAVEHITPGRPCENGAHERMHRTLKAETTRPPAYTMQGQQRRFNSFRPLFNDERPHEALGQRPPASVYTPSTRAYPGDAIDEDVYPGHWERRVIKRNGDIKWGGKRLFIAKPLAGKLVGMVEVDEGRFATEDPDDFEPLAREKLKDQLEFQAAFAAPLIQTERQRARQDVIIIPKADGTPAHPIAFTIHLSYPMFGRAEYCWLIDHYSPAARPSEASPAETPARSTDSS